MGQYDGDTTKGNKDGKHSEERKGKDAEEKRAEDVNHLVLHSSVVDVRLLIPKPLERHNPAQAMPTLHRQKQTPKISTPTFPDRLLSLSLS
ncbi:hypothetical protein RUM43_014878 [Polyplax serrata]|uniref:Uncharacterized protein n=1 Tax=Polyplax serrata TaxID=468196 RepID=A0AAN8NYR7_POLSC